MTVLSVHVDFETRSNADLPKIGAWRYAEDATTDAICMGWAIGDDPVQMWLPGQPFPEEITDALILHGANIVAHNAAFERAIWQGVMTPRYGWPAIPLKSWRCTMAMAYAMSLPGSLDGASSALGMDVQKDMSGHRLMMQMCKPRRVMENGTIVWWDDDDRMARLIAYCKNDVEVERALEKRLLQLRPLEQQLWQLDQVMNQRGVPLDEKLCRRARAFVKKDSLRLDAEMRSLTNGAVSRCTNVNELLTWVRGRGVPAENVRKDTVTDLLGQAIPADVRTALELRRDASKTSTAKLDSMLSRVEQDGRMRGLLQYHGAATGRWAARGPQLQNLPRPSKGRDIEACIADMLSEDYETIRVRHGAVLPMVSDCIRGMIRAPKGRQIVAADYANIEGRVLAWLAGQEDKLNAFRAYDAGAGPDLYLVAAGGIFGVAPESYGKDAPERQIGKVAELACIAGGQRVLTDRGLVPIEWVKTEDKVWDGVEFVDHSGVIFRGIREVIRYDGLIATDDHVVWTEGQQEPVPLGLAAARGKRLARSGFGRTPIRVGRDNPPRAPVHPRMVHSVCRDALHWLRARAMDVLFEPDPWGQPRVPNLFATGCGDSCVAVQARHSDETALREPERPRLRELWRSRYQVSVRDTYRSGRVDQSQLGAPEGTGTRQGGQRRPLRAGQSPICYSAAELVEPEAGQVDRRRLRLRAHSKPVQFLYDAAASLFGAIAKRSRRERHPRGSREAQKLAGHPTPAGRSRVYDILNCGPRNRFTVEGRLVHNCGYQGGANAFATMAVTYGLQIGEQRDMLWEKSSPALREDIADRWGRYGSKSGMDRGSWEAAMCVVLPWRNKNDRIQAYWYALEEAAIDAVNNPGVTRTVGKVAYKKAGSFLWCRLPGGRALCYPYPRLETVETPFGTKTGLVYKGVNSVTRKWGDQKFYGGLAAENITQAVARDLMAEGMLRVEAAGYACILTVHDEIVTETEAGFGSLDEFTALMTELPTWAGGLPVAAEGWIGERYRK